MLEVMERLTAALAALPGIGRRSAERMAIHLARHPDTIGRALTESLAAAQTELAVCPLCGSVTLKTQVPCRLCTDPRREDAILCIVENPADISILEQSGAYGGRYFSLMGRLSPMKGEGPAHLRLPALFERAAAAKEILLAMDSDVEGDATASFLRQELTTRFPQLKITRLAFGLPSGSAVSYSDPVTLARAIQNRTPLTRP